MNKLLAVIKREYLQRVRTKLFVIMTVIGPVLLMVFTVVPGMLMMINTGTTHIAVIDQTEGAKVFGAVRDSLTRPDRGNENGADQKIAETVNSNTKERVEKSAKSFTGSFSVEPVDLKGRTLDSVRQELRNRIAKEAKDKEKLDGYLIIPADILTNNKSSPAYYGRNVSDPITREQIQHAIDSAVRKQRLISHHLTPEEIEQVSKSVNLEVHGINDKGEEGAKKSGAGFVIVFIVAFLIYITVLLYGQVILGSVVEEKETRIAEILFSSVRSSTLMLGKLIGVSMVALTQLSIWILAFAALSTFGISFLAARGIEGLDLNLPIKFLVCFLPYFGLGYAIYATLYLLVGSMVTTTQEGGQVAMPIIFLLMAGLYMAFPVMRGSDAPYAVWLSMVPFFSPIVMLVRILSGNVSWLQIALSLSIGVITVVFLLWLTSRIYRIGALMYGKKASIPEVMRWVKQA